ncbi:MAG: polymer-forming cytoskeletal protein [Desulfovibrio sp.]|jgi:cytoskeletal protein CcmA (bactofilin family)|nr:polymer-forming cytoskeletal protein [Desulfovibrio sp.]
MSKDNNNITALMGKGAEYQGQLSFKGTVRIEGRFLGSISSEGKLVLGKDAYVEGAINVGELEMHGTLQGEIAVANRTLLHSTARLTGSLRTSLLAMEEGALLQGDLQMSQDLCHSSDPAARTLVPAGSPVAFSDTPMKQ